MTLAPMGASLVTQIWLGRHLGRVGLGEYHAASLFVTVLTTVLFFGFPIAVAQRIATLSERRDEREAVAMDTSLTLSLLGAMCVAAIGVLVWTPFALTFGLQAGASPFLVGSALVMAAISGVSVNVFLAKLWLRASTIVILAQPMGVGAAIIASYLGVLATGVELALLGFVVSGFVGLMTWLSHGARVRLDRLEVPKLLGGSVAATLWTYPSLVTGWVDRAIIGVILGPAALGAFVAASTLVEALQRLTRMMTTLGIPAYARLAADTVGSSRVLDSHLRLMTGVFIIAGSAFVAGGSGVLNLLFGEGFGIASTTLRLLSIALLPLGVAIILASQGVGSNTSRSAGRILLLLVPTHLIVSAVATSLFHIAGTALANLIVWTLGSVLYIADARRRNAPLSGRTLLHIAGVGVPLLMASWIVGLSSSSWPLRALLAAVPATLVVGTLLIREPERRLVRRLASARSSSERPVV